MPPKASKETQKEPAKGAKAKSKAAAKKDQKVKEAVEKTSKQSAAKGKHSNRFLTIFTLQNTVISSF
jgi:hypothetical protein